MRQSVTIILLVAFLAQVFTKPFIVLDYYSNTAAYAKNCENKAKPTLHCNGKCQMMKKLKQEEENKEKQNPEKKSGGKDEVLSSKSFYTTFSFYKASISSTYKNYTCGRIVDMPQPVFHPPAV